MKSMTSLQGVLRELTKVIDRDVPITILLVFLAVAEAGAEGVDQGEVMDNLEISSAGMSRAVQSLGKVHYLKGKPGFDLVERTFDPTDNRRRVLKLTSAGEKLARAVLRKMEA